MEQVSKYKSWNYKNLRRKIGVKLYNPAFSSGFSHKIPKAQTTKQKTDKLKFLKIKNFCAKNTIKSMK